MYSKSKASMPCMKSYVKKNQRSKEERWGEKKEEEEENEEEEGKRGNLFRGEARS